MASLRSEQRQLVVLFIIVLVMLGAVLVYLVARLIAPLPMRGVSGDRTAMMGSHQELYQIAAKQGDWQSFWDRHNGFRVGAKLAPPPAVDFQNEFVVGAFWGSKPESCYTIDITGVRASQQTITVNMQRRGGHSPGFFSLLVICNAMVSYPQDLRIVSRSGLPGGPYKVVFKDQNGVVEINQAILP
jgi:hypothetical protein